MKKILVITIVLLSTLTGCGGKTTTSDSNNQKQEIVEAKQEAPMALKDVYGTWTFSKVTIDGSTYTIKEIEAMGDDSLSGVFFVFKEGGSVYMYAGEDDEGNFTYTYNEESNIITVGAKDFVIEGNELVVTADNGTVYMDKYSNSQDITEIPKKSNSEEDIVDDIQDEEPVEVNNNEIRPEVKEAIDSYETFIDEYCAFMQK